MLSRLLTTLAIATVSASNQVSSELMVHMLPTTEKVSAAPPTTVGSSKVCVTSLAAMCMSKILSPLYTIVRSQIQAFLMYGATTPIKVTCTSQLGTSQGAIQVDMWAPWGNPCSESLLDSGALVLSTMHDGWMCDYWGEVTMAWDIPIRA